MTRFTFQFISRPGENDEIKVDLDSNRVASVEEIDEALTEIYLRDGSSIEVLSTGDLRYSVTVESYRDLDLESTFQEGLEIIRDLIEGSENEYSVCLLVNNSDPVSTYLQITDEITQLSEEKFDNEEPSYDELNDNTVKISFRNQRQGILI